MRGTTLRTKKTVDGAKTEYVWLGDMLIREQTGSNVIYYLYDENGSAIGFEYNGTPYYYLKNIQGDVLSIVDNSGVVVVNYAYNAWGEIISITGTMADTIGQVNKLRYRSYYYDSETGFYYLQSRYYDPIVKRFISPDSTDYLTANGDFDGYNLYAYCLNNPVNYSDPSGAVVLVDDLMFLGVAVCVVATVAVASSLMSQPQFQQSLTSFGKAIGSGLSWLWNKITVLFQSARKIVTKAVEKNIAKAKEVINKMKNIDYYWIASKATFSRKSVKMTTYFPCTPINVSAAAIYVRAGGDVFASSKSAARRLAILINGGTPVGPEIHGDSVGYFWHYHARNRVGAGSGGGHIFYMC